MGTNWPLTSIDNCTMQEDKPLKSVGPCASITGKAAQVSKVNRASEAAPKSDAGPPGAQRFGGYVGRHDGNTRSNNEAKGREKYVSKN